MIPKFLSLVTASGVHNFCKTIPLPVSEALIRLPLALRLTAPLILPSPALRLSGETFKTPSFKAAFILMLLKLKVLSITNCLTSALTTASNKLSALKSSGVSGTNSAACAPAIKLKLNAVVCGLAVKVCRLSNSLCNLALTKGLL